MAEASLKRRYLAKASATGYGIVTGLVTAAILARMLGPTQLGAFTFITTFYAAIFGLVGGGALQWFFIRLCQRPGDDDLKRVYWVNVALSGGLGILATLLVLVSGFSSRIWPEIVPSWAWWALALALVSLIAKSVGQMADAEGFTVSAEKFRVLHRTIALVLLAGLFGAGVHSLDWFFLYAVVVQLIWVAGVVVVFARRGQAVFPKRFVDDLVRFRQTAGDFWYYSAPLIWLAAYTGVSRLLERWILQAFAGTVEQGYFGFGERMAAVCYLFVAPIVPLFSRELAVAVEAGTRERSVGLVDRLVPQMFAVAAFLGAFILTNAKEVVQVIGGEKFGAAQGTVAVMALYPVLQTLSQLLGSVFYARSATRLFWKVSVWFGVVGLVATYFALAPRKWGGLDLAAEGLALRTVLVNLGSVIMLLILGCRLLEMPAKRLGIRLVLILTGAVAMGLLASAAACWIPDWRLRILASGLMYTAGVIGGSLRFPALLGLNWRDFVAFFQAAGLRIGPRPN